MSSSFVYEAGSQALTKYEVSHMHALLSLVLSVTKSDEVQNS